MADPTPLEAPTLEEAFRALTAEFDDVTAVWSSATKMVRHPSYLGVVHLGAPVVPLLLRDLQRALSDPLHPLRPWGPALRTITGVSVPVPPEQAGRIRYVAEQWVQWGVREGLLEETTRSVGSHCVVPA